MGLFSSQISTKQMVPLCRQLATADSAGIPIIQSLELVGRQSKDPKTRDVLRQIGDNVRRGSTLSDAARTQSKYLPRFFIELLGTGERGGKLDVMLRELADYYEDRLRIQRQAMAAAALPMMELAAAWVFGTFAFMILNRVMATFKARGESFNFGTFIHDYLVFQGKAVLVALAVLAVCVILSRMGIFRWVWGFFATFIWPIAPVTRKFALARFLRSMSLLVGSGLNIVRCVENSAAVMVNPYLEQDMLKAVEPLRHGATLYEALSGSRYLNRMSREMILVGEHSGQLEASLRNAAEYNLQQATHATEILMRVFGVLILMTVALIVGGLIIMFYTRLYGGMLDELGV